MSSALIKTLVPRAATCIVGLGSDFGDDGLGWCVVERLRDVIGDGTMPSIRVARATSPAELLGSMEGMRELILIDACQGLGKAGQILRLKWPAAEIAKFRHSFGHNVSLDEVLGLAQTLGQLPDVCELRCVEGHQFEFGQLLSPEVASAGEQIVTELMDRLGVACISRNS